MGSGADCDSPPRGRGRHDRRRPLDSPVRLTPAWAGKTVRMPCQAITASTHPRVGGEDDVHSAALGFDLDSPPRGRGRHCPVILQMADSRLTPAWAGKTVIITLRLWSLSTHPRVGGEDDWPCTAVATDDDSPPRGRGRPWWRPRASIGGRLTPAWAGKTMIVGVHSMTRSTHPRVGGEDTRRHPATSWTGDSPPRGRGRRSDRAHVDGAGRLTPAWAGKTRGPLGVHQRRATHPRVGGEDRHHRPVLAPRLDSPPRGRGRRRGGLRRPGPRRLTPAWAGKTPGGRQAP